MTLATVPLVAVKLPVETPVTASLKVAVKLIGPLVTGATMLSVTVVTVGARVSIPWLSRPDRFAATAALPAVSVAPPATRLNATLPDATPAVGLTTTVYWLGVTCVTLAIVPLVAVKLPVETPVTTSLKVAVKLIGPLVTEAATSSVTAVTVGARVSMPWLSRLDRFAATAALPVGRSRRPPPGSAPQCQTPHRPPD